MVVLPWWLLQRQFSVSIFTNLIYIFLGEQWMNSGTQALFKPHLYVYSLDDAGDDVEHLHLGVALRHLLQQLEEQPEDRLQVLCRVRGGNDSL